MAPIGRSVLTDLASVVQCATVQAGQRKLTTIAPEGGEHASPAFDLGARLLVVYGVPATNRVRYASQNPSGWHSETRRTGGGPLTGAALAFSEEGIGHGAFSWGGTLEYGRLVPESGSAVLFSMTALAFLCRRRSRWGWRL